MTSPYPSSAGRLCVWDVGPCGNRHHRGPANRRRPLQHQDDSPQKEEQLQAPEEEGQTARGQYLYLSLVITCYISYWGSILYWVLSLLFFFLPSNLESPGPAVRTRPCCWPTAPKMSSDETLLGFFCRWPMADAAVKEARQTSLLLWLPHPDSTWAVWLWLIWSTECDRV